MKKRNKWERYHDYILAVVEVGEVNTSKQIRQRLFDYNPSPKRAFHHKDMPRPEGIARILNLSPHFVREGKLHSRSYQWRRVE